MARGAPRVNPGGQFTPEAVIGELRPVALCHQIADGRSRFNVGDERQLDTEGLRQSHATRRQGRRQQSVVILEPRRPPTRDRRKHFCIVLASLRWLADPNGREKVGIVFIRQIVDDQRMAAIACGGHQMAEGGATRNDHCPVERIDHR